MEMLLGAVIVRHGGELSTMPPTSATAIDDDAAKHLKGANGCNSSFLHSSYYIEFNSERVIMPPPHRAEEFH